MSGGPLYAEDVADKLGISVRQARRRLAYWEQRYGATLVTVVSAPGSQRIRRCVTAEGLSLAVGVGDSMRRRDVVALDGVLQRVTALEDGQESIRRELATLRSDKVQTC